MAASPPPIVMKQDQEAVERNRLEEAEARAGDGVVGGLAVRFQRHLRGEGRRNRITVECHVRGLATGQHRAHREAKGDENDEEPAELVQVVW